MPLMYFHTVRLPSFSLAVVVSISFEFSLSCCSDGFSFFDDLVNSCFCSERGDIDDLLKEEML